MSREQDRTTRYKEGSLTLAGTVMLGTGVMIGAGIFALTGQMAQMTGVLFPLAFLAAAVIVSFSSYSYIKISDAYPQPGHWHVPLQSLWQSAADRVQRLADVFLDGDRPELPRAYFRFLHHAAVRWR